MNRLVLMKVLTEIAPICFVTPLFCYLCAGQIFDSCNVYGSCRSECSEAIAEVRKTEPLYGGQVESRFCTCGVNVAAVCSHARCELPQATQVFVVVFVFRI